MTAREQWLNSYEKCVSSRDYKLLDKASRILVGNEVPQNGINFWEPLRGICPSKHHFHGIWNWDSAFISMAVCRWDPKLAQEQAQVFFNFQLENGLFPDVLFEGGKTIENRFGKPPVWAWACALMDRRAPDKEFLELAYPYLQKNEEFWCKERKKGLLFVYGASTPVGDPDREVHLGYESGWDNSVRWDGGLENLWPVDLNCFMVSFYQGMQYIALRLGKSEDAETYAAKEKELSALILKYLWDDERQMFCDFDIGRSEFNGVLSPASFMPLWVHIATPKQAAAMEKLARDKKKLYPEMPTVSYDDPGYKTNAYWRGPVWMNVAYFAAKGLYDYGFRDTSMGIRNRLLKLMEQDESIHETYDGPSGKPQNTADFSWSSAFCIEMILEMI